MTKLSGKAVLALAGAAAVVGCLFVRGCSSPAIPSGVVPAPDALAGAHPTVAVPAPVPAPRISVDNNEHGEAFVVAVSSELGRPIPGASIVQSQVPVEGRQATPADRTLLGSTDGSGIVALHAALREGMTLLVQHSRYQSAVLVVPSNPAGKRAQVTLREGARIHITCTTRDGTPVVGAVLEVSRRPLIEGHEWREAPEELLPGGSPATAVYTARTNHAGEAVLESLPTGVVYVRLRHRHFLSAGDLQRKPLELAVGESRLREVFDPIVGALGYVDGDRIIAWSVENPSGLVQTPQAIRELNGVRAALTRGRNDIVALIGAHQFLPKESRYADLPPRCTATLVLATKGIATAEFDVRAAVNLVEPQRVIARPRADGPAMASAAITVANPNGKPVTCTRFVQLYADMPGLEAIAIPLGDATVLPAGTYALRGHTRFLDNALAGQTVTILAGRENVAEVRLKTPLVPCVFDVTDSVGVKVDAADVVLTHNGIIETFSCEYGLGSAEFLLPVGSVSLKLAARGCVATTREVAVVDTGAPNVLRLSVETSN